ERLGAATAARIAQIMDAGGIAVERDGLQDWCAARFAIIALDEGIGAEEAAPAALRDRAAFWLDLDAVTPREAGCDAVASAPRAAAPGPVAVTDAILAALCAAAARLGVASPRAVLFALDAARAIAALEGRDAVTDEDAGTAARLVLAPRATIVPETGDAPTEAASDPGPPPPAEDAPGGGAERPMDDPVERLADRVLAAARAALPRDLLDGMPLASASASAAPGRSGTRAPATGGGRPTGLRPGMPRPNARLDVVATLRAAAPWQRLRSRAPGRIAVRSGDFRVIRTERPIRSTTIFVVDASGSAALHRLAEAKGAVELLLGESYVRRDRAALIAFRGRAAEVLLPPTGSLVRARRGLTAMPAGGGTPLAAGIEAGCAMAATLRRRGETASVVLLTDARANVARDGTPGRLRAQADAAAAAKALRAAGIPALLIDIAPRPSADARLLAAEAGARWLALPQADAVLLSRAARTAAAA
ncbi:MAG TPA: VWA domain-containing protein, partial [Acetobacteraceae bacterium]|nr:VWA domain-containing protein [Acetobacteraceae bacterium]